MGAGQNKEPEWALSVERYTEQTLRDLGNNACCCTRDAITSGTINIFNAFKKSVPKKISTERNEIPKIENV